MLIKQTVSIKFCRQALKESIMDITGGRPGGAGYKGQRPNMRPEAWGPDKPKAFFFCGPIFI